MNSRLNTCLFGDCRDSMRKLIADGVRVNTCVTSPPYFGLRDYGVDGQLGLEATPQEYVSNMVEVFRLVRELLANDGTCWINIGDSYASFKDGKAVPDSARGNSIGTLVPKGSARNRMAATFSHTSIKSKDLIGIPWRVAFALQDDGWFLRQDIIWSKPNPMPESVTDRCTKAHEYLFLLSKSERYYFDQEAIKEDAVGGRETFFRSDSRLKDCRKDSGKHNDNPAQTRNKRSVWTVPTQPYSEAHFATFPPALIEPCILAGAPSGGIVFDPFLGSGTTAQVAQDLGRQWIGCELNPAYSDLQKARTRQSGLQLEAII